MPGTRGKLVQCFRSQCDEDENRGLFFSVRKLAWAFFVRLLSSFLFLGFGDGRQMGSKGEAVSW